MPSREIIDENQPDQKRHVYPPSLAQGPWWRSLKAYHWFVFAMAALAWLFDCLDQQIFLLFRQTALQNLMPEGTDPP